MSDRAPANRDRELSRWPQLGVKSRIKQELLPKYIEQGDVKPSKIKRADATVQFAKLASCSIFKGVNHDLSHVRPIQFARAL